MWFLTPALILMLFQLISVSKKAIRYDGNTPRLLLSIAACINTLRADQMGEIFQTTISKCNLWPNGRNFADDNFKMQFMVKNFVFWFAFRHGLFLEVQIYIVVVTSTSVETVQRHHKAPRHYSESTISWNNVFESKPSLVVSSQITSNRDVQTDPDTQHIA